MVPIGLMELNTYSSNLHWSPETWLSEILRTSYQVQTPCFRITQVLQRNKATEKKMRICVFHLMIFFIVLDIFWTTEIFFLLLDAKLIEHYRLVHRKWENINTVTCVPRNSCSLSAEFVGLKKKSAQLRPFLDFKIKQI